MFYYKLLNESLTLT